MCFVWSCLLNSAERNYVSYAMIDSWASIPAGLWGENGTSTVPGMQRADADAAVLSASASLQPPPHPSARVHVCQECEGGGVSLCLELV